MRWLTTHGLNRNQENNRRHPPKTATVFSIIFEGHFGTLTTKEKQNFMAETLFMQAMGQCG